MSPADNSILRVQTAELRTAKKLVEDVSEDMRTQIDKLRREVDDLLHGWKGDVADEFEPNWQEWLDGAQQVLDALNKSAAALSSAADGFDDVDNPGSSGSPGRD
ncbi:WXG100 family type VII secretion target [Mycolicibacterium sp.]|uniref:WXG100 family type VII secretion target n=1 Tax=Mycolicibacterium sp. TaxID=2320850 RepID=UPI0037CA6995